LPPEVIPSITTSKSLASLTDQPAKINPPELSVVAQFETTGKGLSHTSPVWKLKLTRYRALGLLRLRPHPQDAQDYAWMAAGLSDHIWSLEEIVMMADSYLPQASKRGPYKKRPQSVI
jgi:hypothetical protein